MTSGIHIKSLLRRLTKPLLLAFALVVQTAAAAELDIGEIMRTLSQRQSSRANFVELKYIAALQQPLESSGELFFIAPARLEKLTTKPKSERLVLDGDRLQITRTNGRKITMNISDRPEVSGFVESVRSTLRGDRAALERYYMLAAEGSTGDWRLQLTPREAAMRKVISEIRMTGAHAQIMTIEFQQADGDRSVMTITDEKPL